MTGMLVPLALVLCALAALGCARSDRPSIRDACAAAGAWTALWAAAGAELLSLGHWLDFPATLAWWLVPCLVLGVVLILFRRRIIEAVNAVPALGWRAALLLIPVAAILVLTFVVAAFTPPTTWDCLSYHLPRQIFWMQHHGVQHFPAEDLRWLEMPPLSEFITVQTMILSGGDWGANMVQWTSFALSILVASAIARDLGAPPPRQALAALLVATLPSAATQAVNAKNDVLVGFLTLALVHQALKVWNARECSLGRAAYAGVLAGLLVLAKGTGLVYGLVAGLFFAAAAARAIGVWCIPAGALAAVIALAINTGHWARNLHAFGHPIAVPPGPQGGFGLGNTLFTPAALASNVVRNVSLQMGSPWPGVNAWVQSTVLAIHERLGLAANDIRTTAGSKIEFRVFNEWLNDGNNPAPVHLLAGLVLLVIAISQGRRLLAIRGWPVYLLPAAAFLLFCLVLAWQPWHNRLLIPVFMLVAPGVGGALGLRRMNVLLSPVAIAATALIWQPVLLNGSKPLIGPNRIWKLERDQAALFVEPYFRPLVNDAVRIIHERKAGTVGLCIPWTNSYPLLRRLYFGERPPPRLVLMLPNYALPNPKRAGHTTLLLPEDPELPDVIVNWPWAPASAMVAHGWVYIPVGGRGNFQIYARSEPEPSSAAGPDFAGFESVAGWSPVQNPVPPWNPAEFHYGLAPGTTLAFNSDGSSAALTIEGRNVAPGVRSLEILLNGESIERMALGNAREVMFLRKALAPRTGRNVLEIRYATDRPPETRMFAFQRLTVTADGPRSAPAPEQ